MALRKLAEQAKFLRWLQDAGRTLLEDSTRKMADMLIPLDPYGGLILKELLRQLTVSSEDVRHFIQLREDGEYLAWEVLDEWVGEDNQAIVNLCENLPDHMLEYEGVRYCYALAVHRLGNASRALDMLLQHINENPRDGHYQYAAGNACRTLGILDQAVKHYVLAAKASDAPRLAVFNNLGLTLIEMKDYRRAARYLYKALAIDPEDIGVLQNLVDLFRAWGKMGMARIWRKTALALYPDNEELRAKYEDIRLSHQRPLL